jgi:hypothetical protein
MIRRRFLLLALTSGMTLGISLLFPQLTLRSSAQQSSFYQLPKNEAKALAAVAATSAYYKNFIAKLGIEFTPEKEAVVLGRGRDAFVVISINYRGSSLGGSFVTRLNRKQRKLQEAMAWKIEDTSTGHHALVWHNDQLTTDVTLNDQGTVVSGWVTQATGAGEQTRTGARSNISGQNFVPQAKAAVDIFATELGIKSSSQSFPNYDVAQPQSIKCLNSCLSNAGIPFYILGLIGVGCGVACAITAGLGCFACLAATLGGYLGVGLRCLKNCGYPVPLP